MNVRAAATESPCQSAETMTCGQSQSVQEETATIKQNRKAPQWQQSVLLKHKHMPPTKRAPKNPQRLFKQTAHSLRKPAVWEISTKQLGSSFLHTIEVRQVWMNRGALIWQGWDGVWVCLEPPWEFWTPYTHMSKTLLLTLQHDCGHVL